MGADFLVRGTCYVTRWLGDRWMSKHVID
jgi:hypothetical protein